MALRIRTHRRGRSTASTASTSSLSSTSSSSSSSCDAQTPIATVHNASRARVQRVPGPQIAVVGTGREALALSPHSADEFAQSLNMNMALCSSPEVNLTFPQPGVETKPDPVLRRIASDAVVGLKIQSHSHSRRASGVPSLPSTSSSSAPRGLPPPPRPHRRRPPPVYVSTGPSLALVEQTYSPFCAPKTPTQPRASSVPPSAVSSSFWGSATPKSGSKSLRSARSYASQVGSVSSVTSDEDDLDLDGLEADFDEYDFDDDGKSPLGQTYFAPRRETPVVGSRRPLRVQVSVEQVAFRDNSPKSRRFGSRWESEDEGVAYGWEDGIKSRASIAVEPMATPARQKLSIGKVLGRLLRRHT